MSGLERTIFDIVSGICAVLVMVFYVWGLYCFFKRFNVLERVYDLCKRGNGWYEIAYFIAVVIIFVLIPMVVFIWGGGYGIERVFTLLGWIGFWK